MSFELVCALYRGEMGFSCAIIPKNVAAVQTPQRGKEGESRQFRSDESEDSNESFWTNLL